MVDFEPAGDFVARTMENIRSYERETSRRRERVDKFLFSRTGRMVLISAGILFAALNIFTVASVLISPGLCM